MKTFIPYFLDNDTPVKGKCLIQAANQFDAIDKIEALLKDPNINAFILPYKHWTPFSHVEEIAFGPNGLYFV